MLPPNYNGISFIERPDIPVYNPDVKAFEVRKPTGAISEYYIRIICHAPTNAAGAWDNSFRERYFDGNKVVTPIVVNCFNFSLPTGDTPSLLTLDEVETLFHEFGHGLHDLLTECNYQKVTGTNVPRDFVELPSQIMENWATHPEVLKTFAKHYQTGEPIPDELIAKIQNSNLFNQGFATVEFLAASYLDMDWHTITQPQTDVMTFENKAMQKIGLIPEIVVRYRSPYFQHIFAGGYSAVITATSGPRYWMPMLSRLSKKTVYSIRLQPKLFVKIFWPKGAAKIRWFYINASAGPNRKLTLC
jgi:peptidyl-dipeptidase Dcp